jgi:hypothetical protein
MLKKFKMEDCKHVSTLMAIGFKLRKYDYSKKEDQIIYGSMIGSILYVIASRPDVMQVVGTGADPGFNTSTTHQQNPNYRPFRQHLRSR